MSRTRRTVFVALVLAQALVPLGLIGWSELALARGTEVRLRTVPVDPVDLFRGRYVTLRYEISGLPVDRASRGDTVYVELDRRGDVWSGDHASRVRPNGDGPFIRGVVTGSGIEYGIETYYADEDEARRLEREAAGRLLVDVVLDADGGARIAGVEVAGTR